MSRYDLRAMGVFVTHNGAHLDEWVVKYLAHRFVGLPANLPVHFVNDSDELATVPLPKHYFAVGVDKGPFDEHGSDGRKQTESAVSRAIAEFGLDLSDLPGLKAVLDATHLGDTEGDQHPAHLDALIKVFTVLNSLNVDAHRDLGADVVIAIDALANSWGQMSEADYATADELFDRWLAFLKNGDKLPKNIRSPLRRNWREDKTAGVVLGSPLHIRTVIAALLKHEQIQIAKRMMAELLGAFVTRQKEVGDFQNSWNERIEFTTNSGLTVALIRSRTPFGMTGLRQKRHHLQRQQQHGGKGDGPVQNEQLPDIVVMKTVTALGEQIGVWTFSEAGHRKAPIIVSQISRMEFQLSRHDVRDRTPFLREVMGIVARGNNHNLPAPASMWYLQFIKEGISLLNGSLTRRSSAPTRINTEQLWMETLQGT
jgi:hypothetical protein